MNSKVSLLNGICRVILIGLTWLLLLGTLGVLSAVGQTAYVDDLRSIYTRKYSVPLPAALTYSPEANALLVAGYPDLNRPSAVEAVTISVFKDLLGRIELPLPLPGPFFMAFSQRANALFILDVRTNQVVSIPAGPGGRLDPSGRPVAAFNATDFHIRQPKGLTADPGSGDLYILDGGGPFVVRLRPDTNQNFNPSSAERHGPLVLPDPSPLQGLAFNSANGRIYVLNSQNDVFELDHLGGIVSTRRLASLGLTTVASLVFAPSADLTDDPSVMSLFVLEASPPQGGPPGQKPAPRIVELLLTAPVLAPSTLSAPVIPVAALRQKIDRRRGPLEAGRESPSPQAALPGAAGLPPSRGRAASARKKAAISSSGSWRSCEALGCGASR